MDFHDLDDMVRISADFYDLSGNLADPDVVELKIRKPDDSAVTLTVGSGVTRASQGKYRADVVGDQGGLWKYRWIGSGTVQSAGESSLYVRPTLVP